MLGNNNCLINFLTDKHHPSLCMNKTIKRDINVRNNDETAHNDHHKRAHFINRATRRDVFTGGKKTRQWSDDGQVQKGV